MRLVHEAVDDPPPLLKEEVIRAAQAGDRRSLELVFGALYPLVRKQLYFQLGAGLREIFEEAVQESMVKIFRGLPTFRGDARITTWSLAIAIREGRRHARRWHSYTTVALEDWSAVGFSDPAPSASATLLAQSLAALKPKKREAFILMHLFELTAAEAGQVLGVSGNTAASRSRHAMLELRRALVKDEA